MGKSKTDSIRILGVDSALRSTGLGVIGVRGTRLEVLQHGLVKNPAAWPRSRCLSRLQTAITEILEQSKPESVAIEGVFFCKNVRTAVSLGEVRGVVIAACAAAGKPVYEYPPRRVKQAVVGFGAASKEQVMRMVVRLLDLRAPPPEDVADALAIAICHAHSRKLGAFMDAKEI
ncbi:MAG: crossover junction endodeoxyribonuclease RuvC [Lentisphaerae bacterium]|nr:crossover junction endodeoxyribonuclease RuvC [Lentisphaerota bacterium]